MIGSLPLGIGLVFLLTVSVPARSGFAGECVVDELSRLEVHRLKADKVTEHTASPEQIAQLTNVDAGPAPHPLMAIADEFDGHFAFEHRIVRAPDGGYRDVPETIALRFGVIRRHVYLTAAAAQDACVRSALMAHEDEHNTAVNEAVSALLHQHRDDLAADMAALKQNPASTKIAARAALEARLQAVLARLLRQFREEQVGRIRSSIDSISRLATLRNACDGRLGELEKPLRRDGRGI
jgi:hypothetical protein